MLYDVIISSEAKLICSPSAALSTNYSLHATYLIGYILMMNYLRNKSITLSLPNANFEHTPGYFFKAGFSCILYFQRRIFNMHEDIKINPIHISKHCSVETLKIRVAYYKSIYLYFVFR